MNSFHIYHLSKTELSLSLKKFCFHHNIIVTKVDELSSLYTQLSDYQFSVSQWDMAIFEVDAYSDDEVKDLINFTSSFDDIFKFIFVSSNKDKWEKYNSKIVIYSQNELESNIDKILKSFFNFTKDEYILENNMIYSMTDHTLTDINNNTITLTSSETVLIEFLLKNNNSYQSNETLQNILSKNWDCSIDNLRTYIKNIRKKTSSKTILNKSGFGYQINIIGNKNDKEKKVNILIVDDQKVNIEFLSLLISKKLDNINIIKASGGKEAIKYLKKNTIHVVLLDLDMPDVTGWDVAKFVKNNLGDKNIAVIFITSVYLSNEFQKEGFELGAVDYLTKPIDRNLLINRLGLYIKNFKQERKIVEQIELSRKQEKKLLQKEVLLSQSNILEKIAHHWRQPLSIIAMHAENIKLGLENGLEKSTIINSSEQISSLTQDMSNMINDFQHFFNHQEVKKDFNVENTILSIVDILKLSFKQNRVELILEVEPVVCYSFENEFKQVIITLLDNALEALSLNDIKKPYILIDAKVKNGYLEVQVIDNAGGVDSSIEHRIYEPYFTTKHEYYGAGLSLHTASQIAVRYLNGSIENKNISKEFAGKTYSCAQFTLKFNI